MWCAIITPTSHRGIIIIIIIIPLAYTFILWYRTVWYVK